MRITKLTALAAGAILWASLAPLAAQEAAQGEAKGFSFNVDPFVLTYLNSDSDTDSAKFMEYRDLEDGVTGFLRLSGKSADGERFLDLNADNIGYDDARYTFGYGSVGRYSLVVDYNLIVHNFGNNGRMLFNRTGPGRYEIADATQIALQNATAANRALLTYPFLKNLVDPYLANANVVDIGLQRDRLLVRADLGRMAAFNWGVEFFQEKRDGTRPFGATFGFNNITELPEPIDYTTQDAEVSGEWNSENAGLRFGYRTSKFENDISTVTWDNPFRFTNSTDPSAYQAPSSASVGGSALGFADLAPDNTADQLFLSGRARFGTWFVNGNAAMITMEQDDALLPYTLNNAIVGINFNGSTFDPTNPANLPERNADNKVDVTTFTAQAGTDLGESFDLSFRYRFYDYDNQSKRIEFPGYVRFHGVWEDIARVNVPYGYTREDASAELGWDIGKKSRLALSYGLQSWDREFREVESSDEDILRLTFDTRPMDRLTVRARYEIGDRSIDGYDVEAAEASFVEPEGVSLPAGLRRFDEAERNYDDYNVQAQWFATDAWNFTFGVTGRDEDYDKSELGLQSDDIFQYNAELAFVPSDALTLYLFGQWADRQTFMISRQSGAVPSTNPIDNWEARFDENTATLGLGFTTAFAERWTADLSVRRSDSNGDADFTAFPGGQPLASPPRTAAQDFGNYEDTELTAALAKLGFQINNRFSLGLGYLWEDYNIDSFILQDLQNYLPGALLLNADNGDYQGSVVYFDVGVKF
jgi:MtrB/PioB family decaheme-associated outer membrane protein